MFYAVSYLKHTLGYCKVHYTHDIEQARLQIQKRNNASLEYTFIFPYDSAILYFENRNIRISSFFNRLDLRCQVLNLQSVKLAHISQNACVSVGVWGIISPNDGCLASRSLMGITTRISYLEKVTICPYSLENASWLFVGGSRS